MRETYEVKYNIKYCDEPYWKMGITEIVEVMAAENTKGNNHYSARLKVELDLRADRICSYRIISITYQ